jgi:hypothetical protein
MKFELLFTPQGNNDLQGLEDNPAARSVPNILVTWKA